MCSQDCKKDILYLIKYLAKLLRADYDERVAKFGLTGAQARILSFIYRRNALEQVEVHQNDIEKEFSLAKSTVNGLVSRLLKSGYLIKKNSRPYAVLEVSESGLLIIEEIREGRAETINRIFEGYSEEEKESTLTKLRQLIDKLEGGRKDAQNN